ncbi:hypothetical protein WMY93_032663 [Mugilogobius chulae]|uniref:Serine-threonine/tyrosine-protein kinase catalytic domain-containing protein n=1 Tax=Mugilogobius chulae TaxID=88201 RepID=A0AAW0MNG3_9GOBI
MWEVMTRGQTPYPGVENSEIYEYLIKGERLKKPPDCRPDMCYELMHSCWSPVPKCRPSFSDLVTQLQTLLLSLESNPQPAALLYVNLQEEGAGLRRKGRGYSSRGGVTALLETTRLDVFGIRSSSGHRRRLQGCCLSPLLYILYTHQCRSSHQDRHILKFADDSVIVESAVGG